MLSPFWLERANKLFPSRLRSKNLANRSKKPVVAAVLYSTCVSVVRFRSAKRDSRHNERAEIAKASSKTNAPITMRTTFIITTANQLVRKVSIQWLSGGAGCRRQRSVQFEGTSFISSTCTLGRGRCCDPFFDGGRYPIYPKPHDTYRYCHVNQSKLLLFRSPNICVYVLCMYVWSSHIAEYGSTG